MERSEIFKKFKPDMINMLGLLHELQNNSSQNYLCEDDLREVAKYLNTTYSHVFGVATYYTMYSVKPRGRHLIRVCNSPVCNMEGAPGMVEVLEELLGIRRGETTADEIFTLEMTECLGRCSVAPSMLIGEDIYGELNREKILDILGNYK